MTFRRSAVILIGLAAPFSCTAQAPTNLALTLYNTSFERPSIIMGAMQGVEPKSWFYFSSNLERRGGISDLQRRTGMQSIVFKAQVGTTNYQGIAQRFRAMPGYRYTFAATALIDPQDPLVGDSYGQISLEFQDESGEEIARLYGSSINKDTPPGRWTRILVELDAPTNARLGVAVVTAFSRDERAIGTFYVDDCVLASRRAAAP